MGLQIFCEIPHFRKTITAIGYPCFYKITPFLSFEGKKQGQTHLFFSDRPIAHYLDASKTGKNWWNCVVLYFNQIKA